MRGARRLHGEHRQLALARGQRRHLLAALRPVEGFCAGRAAAKQSLRHRRPQGPAPKDLKELIAWLKANPDKATEGTAGPGAGQHISGVYFQNVTGTRFQFVPYRAGSSEIMRDLVAGHID